MTYPTIHVFTLEGHKFRHIPVLETSINIQQSIKTQRSEVCKHSTFFIVFQKEWSTILCTTIKPLQASWYYIFLLHYRTVSKQHASMRPLCAYIWQTRFTTFTFIQIFKPTLCCCLFESHITLTRHFVWNRTWKTSSAWSTRYYTWWSSLFKHWPT